MGTTNFVHVIYEQWFMSHERESKSICNFKVIVCRNNKTIVEHGSYSYVYQIYIFSSI